MYYGTSVPVHVFVFTLLPYRYFLLHVCHMTTTEPYIIQACLFPFTAQAPYLSLAQMTDGPELKSETATTVDVSFEQNLELIARSDKNFYVYIVQVCLITYFCFSVNEY